MCKRRVLLRREEQHHHQFDRADYREKGKKKGREREREKKKWLLFYSLGYLRE